MLAADGKRVRLAPRRTALFLPSCEFHCESESIVSVLIHDSARQLTATAAALAGSADDGDPFLRYRLHRPVFLDGSEDPRRPALLASLRQALRLLDQLASLEGQAFAALQLEDLLRRHLALLLWPALLNPHGSAPAAAGRDPILQALLEWMDAHHHEPITLTQLARRSGDSLRNLQYRFRRQVGCTPMQWLRRRRLEAAHADLQRARCRGVRGRHRPPPWVPPSLRLRRQLSAGVRAAALAAATWGAPGWRSKGNNERQQRRPPAGLIRRSSPSRLRRERSGDNPPFHPLTAPPHGPAHRCPEDRADAPRCGGSSAGARGPPRHGGRRPLRHGRPVAADLSPAASAEEPAGNERAEAADDASGAEVPAAADISPPAADTPPAAGAEEPGEQESASEPPESPWAGTLELYGFAPLRTTTTATVRGFSATTDVGLGTLLRAPHRSSATARQHRVRPHRPAHRSQLCGRRGGAVPARLRVAAQERSPRGAWIAVGASVDADRDPHANVRSASAGPLRPRVALSVRHAGEGDREERSSATLIPYAGVRLLDVATDVNVKTRTSVDGEAARPSVDAWSPWKGNVSSPCKRQFSRSFGGPCCNP